MGRLIGSVLAGYAVIFALIFATFSAAYLLMGADRAFEPGSYNVTVSWIVVSLVLGLVASVAGGWVAATIAKTPAGPKALAILVVVLGVLYAIPAFTAKDPGPRAAEVSNMAAMQQARTPPGSLCSIR